MRAAMSRALQTVPLIRMEPPYTIGHPFHTQTSAALPIGSGKNLFLGKGSCRRNPTHYREMMNPPSMKITWPFTKSAAGEARKAATEATSDGLPQRFAGVCRMM